MSIDQSTSWLPGTRIRRAGSLWIRYVSRSRLRNDRRRSYSPFSARRERSPLTTMKSKVPGLRTAAGPCHASSRERKVGVRWRSERWRTRIERGPIGYAKGVTIWDRTDGSGRQAQRGVRDQRERRRVISARPLVPEAETAGVGSEAAARKSGS